ncbi:MAG: hypothetical protein J5855_00185 [Mailhella sp.]|nr:hypothetical protein [Mailhella sp.]
MDVMDIVGWALNTFFLQKKGYGTISNIRREGRGLAADLVLKGLEERLITVFCEDVKISSDNTSVYLGSFGSDVPFVERVLNGFFARREYGIPQPDNFLTKQALKQAANALRGMMDK